MKKWKPISKAPTNTKAMFVVKAFNVKIGGVSYTSDPYCVWSENGKFIRWPHPFSPTHYCELPTDIEYSFAEKENEDQNKNRL